MRSKAQPLPAMEAEPELFEDLVGVVKAYGELQGDRVDGGLLPWAAASRWCSDHDIRGSERLRWCRLLVGMAMADVTERSKRRGKGGT